MIDEWDVDFAQEMCETIHGRIDLHTKLENKESAYALYSEWYVEGFDPVDDESYEFLYLEELRDSHEIEYRAIDDTFPNTTSKYQHLDFE